MGACMIIKKISKLLVVLNANTRPAHLAAGCAWGILLALVPSGNLLWVGLFILTFFLKINTTMQMLALGLGKLLVPLLGNTLHSLGYSVLSLPALEPFFTRLYNIPLVPFTRFNNTLVTGGLLSGVICWPLIFLVVLWLVTFYRRYLRERIVKSGWGKFFMKSPFIARLYRTYTKASGIYTDFNG